MASPETLLPNGSSTAGAWTFNTTSMHEDIDNTVDSPTDSEFTTITGLNEGDTVDFDFGASEVVDSDTVTGITVRIRCAGTGPSAKDDIQVDLLISGSPVGTQQATGALGTISNISLTDATGWAVDRTAAEMDGLQVRLTATQAGKAESLGIEVYEMEVVVTFTSAPSGPSMPIVMHHRMKNFGMS